MFEIRIHHMWTKWGCIYVYICSWNDEIQETDTGNWFGLKVIVSSPYIKSEFQQIYYASSLEKKNITMLLLWISSYSHEWHLSLDKLHSEMSRVWMLLQLTFHINLFSRILEVLLCWFYMEYFKFSFYISWSSCFSRSTKSI